MTMAVTAVGAALMLPESTLVARLALEAIAALFPFAMGFAAPIPVGPVPVHGSDRHGPYRAPLCRAGGSQLAAVRPINH